MLHPPPTSPSIVYVLRIVCSVVDTVAVADQQGSRAACWRVQRAISMCVLIIVALP